MDITTHWLSWTGQFVLILIRISGLFLLSPIWGRANVPATLKVGLSVMLSFIMAGFFPPPAALPYHSLFSFFLVCAGELLIGFCLGFVTTLFFSLVLIAGQTIDTQVGFGMVQVFDVQQSNQVPVTGSLLNLVLMLCFLISGGHLSLIRILMQTFDCIPIGHVYFSDALPAVILGAFIQTFLLAIQVAMPIIASGLLVEFSLGMVVRTAPQMNVFVIGIPIKLIVGIIMLILITPVFVALTGPIFEQMFQYVKLVMDAMVPP